MADDTSRPSFQYFSNARDVHIHGPTTFNTAGGNISHQQSVADLYVRLQPISDATHSRARKICTRGTRTSVIRNVTTWADSEVGPNNHVFFLTGCIGSGKSTISQTISMHFRRGDRLGGSFFFSRQLGERSTMSKFVATLASQLANAVPDTVPFIKDSLNSQSQLLYPARWHHTEIPFDDQLHSLILTPFKAVWDRGGFPRHRQPLIIIVDGLDACEETQHVQVFLDAILDFFSKNPLVPLRFFIATRMERHLVGAFSKEEVVHDDLASHRSEDDMYIFLEASFSPKILKRNRIIQSYIQQFDIPWPLPCELYSLSCHAKGSFRLASDMVQYILGPSNDGLSPMERLPLALEMEPNPAAFYMQIFSRCQDRPHFFEIISTMTLLTTPLSISSLAEFLGLPVFKILLVLQDLQSVIQVPGTNDEPVTFHHDFLRDLFKDGTRSAQLHVSPANHLVLSYRCFLRNLCCGPMSSPGKRTPAAAYSIANCTVHWHSFFQQCQNGIADEIENFSRGLTLEGIPRRAFLSSLFVWELFHRDQSSLLPASFLSYLFLNWTKQLELAIEEGAYSKIDHWYNLRIGQAIPCTPFRGTRSIELSEDAFQTFQANVLSASSLVAEKLSGALNFPQRTSQSLSGINVSSSIRTPQSNVNLSHSLSPAMTLAALASTASRHRVAQSIGEGRYIRLDFDVVLTSSDKDSPSLSEVHDEPDDSDDYDDSDEELEDVQCFLDTQPNPNNPYASYRFPNRTLYIQ